MKVYNNLYDEPVKDLETPAIETKESEENLDDKEVNFILGGQEPGPDLMEMTDGISISDSVVYLTGTIDEFTLADTIVKVRSVLKNREESKVGDPLNLIIDSFGGCAYSMFGIVDYMESLDVKVNTICRGKAMSAGAIILACGTGTRAASKRSTLMVHQGMAMSSGKTGDIRSSANHYSQMDDLMYDLLGEKTNKDAKWWKANMSHDKYMTASEAIELGIIDEIG